MVRFDLTEEEAQESLRTSWQPVLRVPSTDRVLDDPCPTPEQFSYACLTKSLVIGNIGLSKEITPLGNGFWAIGTILQEMLLFNQLNKIIYYADYDAFADRDYAQFRPCARDFGSFLAAMLQYCRYDRDFYTDDTDSQPLDISKEELALRTLRASGIEDFNNILAQLY